jgi:hypothetical protein
MVAVALLVGVVSAIAQLITAAQMETADSLKQVKATALANAMIQEVLAQPYYGPGGTTPTGPGALTRSTYNAMGCYNGFSETAGSVADASGSAYPSDYQGFSVSVTCTYNSLTLTGLTGTTSGLTITVTVSDGNGHSWVVTQFVTSS